MYKPSLKSTWTLAVLAIVAFGMYLLAEYSRKPVRQPHYEQKMEAARLMERAIQAIKEHRMPQVVLVDQVNDPAQTAMVGQQYTLITSSEGNLDAKLTSINPNFAAVIVDIFQEAGLREGDQVAVGMSGSFPALNIAVLVACEVLKLNPVVITSVSSSWWGANDPDCTWLDMESVLNERGILSTRSVAASVGGGGDIGRSLSPEGRELIHYAIQRNGVPEITRPDLQDGIDKRYELYMKHLQPVGYRAYVNVGGGVASLGHEENGKLIPSGLSRNLQMINYPRKGVIHKFADQGIPVINIKHVDQLAHKYGLPIDPMQLPEVGEGKIFQQVEYDLRVTWLAVILISILVGIVMKIDFTTFRLAEEGTDPDNL